MRERRFTIATLVFLFLLTSMGVAAYAQYDDNSIDKWQTKGKFDHLRGTALLLLRG